MSEIYRSESEVANGLSRLKVGDVVLSLIPQGEQAAKCLKLGIPVVFGCVDLVSPPYLEVPEVTLWSTLFGGFQKDFGTDAERTFSPQTVEQFEAEEAESYIPRASEGRFEYGQLVKMNLPQDSVSIVLDSYFDGIVSGKSEDGERCSGGASYFTPVVK